VGGPWRTACLIGYPPQPLDVGDACKGDFEGRELRAVTGSGIDSCLNMGEVLNPFGASRSSKVAEALANGSNSALCLATGLEYGS